MINTTLCFLILSILDEKLSFVHEHSSTMDSFIDHTLQELEEFRKDVVNVQEYAAKYGYKAGENAIFKPFVKEALQAEAIAQEKVEEIIRLRNESNVIHHGTNTALVTREGESEVRRMSNSEDNCEPRPNNTLLKESTSLQDMNPQTDTPKLIQIGLSKDTLKQMGFTFKETTDKRSKDANDRNIKIPQTSANAYEDKLGVNNARPTMPPTNANKSILSDEDAPIFSILKSTKGTVDQPRNTFQIDDKSIDDWNSNRNLCLAETTGDDITITSDISIMHAPITNSYNTSIEVSRVEISPGLIVKRPSSRKNQITREMDETEKNRTKDNENKPEILPSSPDKLTHNDMDKNKPNVSSDESPVMPSLKTVDVKKFFEKQKESYLKESAIATETRNALNEDCTEDNHIDLQKVDENLHSIPPNIGINSNPYIDMSKETASPEMPILKTVNLTKYLSNFNSSDNCRNNEAGKGDNASCQDILKAINTNISNQENKTPDMPQLATISPR